MALEREIETYNSRLSELKAHEGRFVLIQGSDILDFFSSYDDAIKDGYKRFGVSTPFLVKQIQSIQQVQFITRFVAPTPLGA